MRSLKQESGAKEDKERRDSRKVQRLPDPPDAPVYDKAAFLSSSSTDSLAFPRGGINHRAPRPHKPLVSPAPCTPHQPRP